MALAGKSKPDDKKSEGWQNGRNFLAVASAWYDTKFKKQDL